MSKKRFDPKRVSDLLKRLDAAPSGTIESGRVGVKPPGVKLPDVESMLSRIYFPTEEARQRAIDQVQRGKSTAAESRKQAQAAQAAADQRAQERAATSGPIAGIPGAPTLPPSGQSDEKPADNRGGGPRVLLDYIVPPPHTLTTKAGRYCETFRWFNQAFLVYDPSLPAAARGSEHNPWFGLAGPKFRCYFPSSTAEDFEACMTSGSSGRWLHAWGQQHNYIRF